MAKWFGWTLVAFILYAVMCVAVMCASFILLQRQSVTDLPWLSSVQHYLYGKGVRSIWQAKTDCVSFDPELIYRPALGACEFNNLEFKTRLDFSDEGRFTGTKPEGVGVAVIGDSHAMGWGVENSETFAAHLQSALNRPVYNLAVAGYGTIRELARLEQSGVLAKVDTIVIQYCENDLKENRKFKKLTLQESQKKFSKITKERTVLGYLKFFHKAFWVTFKAPFASIKTSFFGEDQKSFAAHYQPFIDVLSQYKTLKDKRIIVFYSNDYGEKFSDFPEGRDKSLANIEFVDPGLTRNDYFAIDDHLNKNGHKKIAEFLSGLLLPKP